MTVSYPFDCRLTARLHLVVAVDGSDGIYVGHRGRTERAELLVGSVAKDLVERAPIPVTVVG